MNTLSEIVKAKFKKKLNFSMEPKKIIDQFPN
jgi:hypothetical protein